MQTCGSPHLQSSPCLLAGSQQACHVEGVLLNVPVAPVCIEAAYRSADVLGVCAAHEGCAAVRDTAPGMVAGRVQEDWDGQQFHGVASCSVCVDALACAGLCTALLCMQTVQEAEFARAVLCLDDLDELVTQQGVKVRAAKASVTRDCFDRHLAGAEHAQCHVKGTATQIEHQHGARALKRKDALSDTASRVLVRPPNMGVGVKLT